MRILHISDKEIHVQMQKIFTPVLQGESASVLCYPRCKVAYNLSAFLKKPTLLKKYLGPHYKKYEFIVVTLEKDETRESFLEKIITDKKQRSLIEFCKKIIRDGKDPYFFILQADYPLYTTTNKILSLLHSCVLRLEKVGVMLFFETNIFGSNSLGDTFQEHNKFIQNVIFLPLYSKIERDIFLHNLCLDWKIHPPKKLISEISMSFGGSLWLLREGLRCFKDYGYSDINRIIATPGIQLRIQAILTQLTSEEKKYIAQAQSNQTINSTDPIHSYLSHIGLIEQKNKKWFITIPVLVPYLEELNTTQNLTISGKRILFRNKDISFLFTPQEKNILTVLLNRKGMLVERDSIAKALWKEEWQEKYSDWAIDKLISRLKTTLQSLGIPRNIIQVKKGRGIQI